MADPSSGCSRKKRRSEKSVDGPMADGCEGKELVGRLDLKYHEGVLEGGSMRADNPQVEEVLGNTRFIRPTDEVVNAEKNLENALIGQIGVTAWTSHIKQIPAVKFLAISEPLCGGKLIRHLPILVQTGTEQIVGVVVFQLIHLIATALIAGVLRKSMIMIRIASPQVGNKLVTKELGSVLVVVQTVVKLWYATFVSTC